jgi:hypothetical protein
VLEQRDIFARGASVSKLAARADTDEDVHLALECHRAIDRDERIAASCNGRSADNPATAWSSTDQTQRLRCVMLAQEAVSMHDRPNSI